MRLIAGIALVGLIQSCTTAVYQAPVPVLRPQPSCEVTAEQPPSEEGIPHLSIEDIDGVIKANIEAIRICYEKSMEGGTLRAGRVKVDFSIGCNGTVFRSQILATSFNHNGPEQCIIDEIATWQFPTPRNGGQVNVKYPFTFKPRSRD